MRTTWKEDFTRKTTLSDSESSEREIRGWPNIRPVQTPPLSSFWIHATFLYMTNPLFHYHHHPAFFLFFLLSGFKDMSMSVVIVSGWHFLECRQHGMICKRRRVHSLCTGLDNDEIVPTSVAADTDILEIFKGGVGGKERKKGGRI